MSKKILKRSLALGALMAFVITGSVWAGDNRIVNTTSTSSSENPYKIEDDSFSDFNPSGKSTGGAVYNSGVLEVINSNFYNNKLKEGGAIYNAGTMVITDETSFESNKATSSGGAIYNKGSLTIVGEENNRILFKGNESSGQGGAIYNTGTLIIAKSDFIDNIVNVSSGHPKGGAITTVGGNLSLTDCVFTNNKAQGTKSAYGVAIHISGTNSSLDGCTFSGHSDSPIYVNTGSVELKDDNDFNGNKGALHIVAGSMRVTGKGNNLEDNFGRPAIYVAGGTVDFDSGSESKLSGNTSLDIYTKGNGRVNVNQGSIVESNSGIKSTNEDGFNINGGTLKAGANIDIYNLGGTGGTIEFLEKIDFTVDKNEVTGKLNFVAEDGTITDAVNGDIEELIGDDFAGNENGATFRLAKGSVVGEVTGELVKGEDGNYEIESSTEAPHEGNAAISHNANIAMMAWRAETNDMNKRLGELRNANGDLGVWVRMVGGEDEFKSVKHEYTQYQLGYDEKLSVDPSWTVGVALSYTDGESTFTNGSGENTHKGLSVYGSKLNDDGSFIDLIAKYSRLEHDITSAGDKGDYSTNGYSVSAEYGKRFQQGKGLWIEPQVELTYGKVKSAEYLLGQKTVSQDAMESLIGRIGFSLGKDIKQGNVYARASYLYDFEGETNMAFTNGASRSFKYDLGGGWWEVGVGANINLSKATYIYADVEKTFGGEVDTNWQWNLGVRYSF